MTKNFRHVCLVVRDLKRSLKFYQDAIGLKVVKIITVEGRQVEKILGIRGVKLTYAKLRSPDQPKNSPAIFELHFYERPIVLPKPNRSHIAFTVSNINREYKRLKKAGVKFISKPTKVAAGNSKICFGYDPNGHLIEFMEELR